VCAIFLAVTGCGGGGAKEPETAANAANATPPAAEQPAPANFSDQVALGQALYKEHCASCHGASGEGSSKAPAVVGLKTGALPLAPPATAKFRKNEFKTVADIAEFVVKNMPADAPGTLTEEQYYSVLAFDLKANGIDLGDKKLDGALAATLTVPR
jgi:cytochrome c